jgi:hypothetical protein
MQQAADFYQPLTEEFVIGKQQSRRPQASSSRGGRSTAPPQGEKA